MRAQLPKASGSELEVLKVLWKHGPGTVREINVILQRQGRRWAYTTVLTLLQRLHAKGYVRSRKEGIANVFSAVVSRDSLLRHRLKELSKQLADGLMTPLVQAFVEAHRFSQEEIEEFRRLLDHIEPERKKKR